MKITISYVAIFLLALTTLASCKKDVDDLSFDNVFREPYSTGIIKLQYEIPTIINGVSATKDTTVSFTSIGNNPSEKDDYGYSQPSIPWMQLHRLNPVDFQNRTFIFFPGTNLNSLTLPYKFKSGNIQDAQINYVIGPRPFYDINGNLVYGTNTYAASVSSDNLELTILSRINNRLQGTFTGALKNQDGLTIVIKRGLFDIQIAEK